MASMPMPYHGEGIVEEVRYTDGDINVESLNGKRVTFTQACLPPSTLLHQIYPGSKVLLTYRRIFDQQTQGYVYLASKVQQAGLPAVYEGTARYSFIRGADLNHGVLHDANYIERSPIYVSQAVIDRSPVPKPIADNTTLRYKCVSNPEFSARRRHHAFTCVELQPVIQVPPSPPLSYSSRTAAPPNAINASPPRMTENGFMHQQNGFMQQQQGDVMFPPLVEPTRKQQQQPSNFTGEDGGGDDVIESPFVVKSPFATRQAPKVVRPQPRSFNSVPTEPVPEPEPTPTPLFSLMADLNLSAIPRGDLSTAGPPGFTQPTMPMRSTFGASFNGFGFGSAASSACDLALAPVPALDLRQMVDRNLGNTVTHENLLTAARAMMELLFHKPHTTSAQHRSRILRRLMPEIPRPK